jgi:hypothetical protein
MVPVDEGVHFEHIQIIRGEIKLGSFERARDGKNKAILDVQLPLNLDVALP